MPGKKCRYAYDPDDPSMVEFGVIGVSDRAFYMLCAGLAFFLSGGGLMILSVLGLARGMIVLDERRY